MPKQRERGTGSLIKIAGCRFWYAQFYDATGRQRRVSTKTEVKQAAEKKLRQLMGDSERGIVPIQDLKKVRYADLRKALLDDYATRGNKSLLTTSDGDETICGLNHLDEFFEYGGPEKPGVPATRMTTDSAREFARKRQADGAGNAIINRSLSALRRMLRIAQEDGKIQFIPKIRFLREPSPRKGFLKREDFDRLIAEVPDALKPLVTFLYFCGVRLGEAKQITWEQVDLNAALIRLEEEQTKTGEPRIVPLPDVLVRMLRAMGPKDGTVFCATNLRKAWAAACVRAGLGTLEDVESSHDKRYNGLIIHDLRRSAIRNLIAAGVSEKVAMSISGHRTRSVFDRYNIVDAADVQNAMRRVESLANGEKIVKISRRPERKRLQAADSKTTGRSFNR